MTAVTTVGEWEPRYDLPPVKHQVRDLRTGLVFEELRMVSDRKVLTTWREDGQKFGRWNWQSGIPSQVKR